MCIRDREEGGGPLLLAVGAGRPDDSPETRRGGDPLLAQCPAPLRRQASAAGCAVGAHNGARPGSA
eukprot:8324426-Alexandrium_andersonii.AAC.1